MHLETFTLFMEDVSNLSNGNVEVRIVINDKTYQIVDVEKDNDTILIRGIG